MLGIPLTPRDPNLDDGFVCLSWGLDPASGRRIVGRVGASSNLQGRVDVVLEPKKDPAPPPRIVDGAGWVKVQARDLVKRLLSEALKTRNLDSIAEATGAPAHLLRLALASVSTEPASLLTLAEVMRLADVAGQALATQPGPDYVRRLQEGSLLTVVEVPHTDLLHVAPPARDLDGPGGTEERGLMPWSLSSERPRQHVEPVVADIAQRDLVAEVGGAPSPGATLADPWVLVGKEPVNGMKVDQLHAHTPAGAGPDKPLMVRVEGILVSVAHAPGREEFRLGEQFGPVFPPRVDVHLERSKGAAVKVASVNSSVEVVGVERLPAAEQRRIMLTDAQVDLVVQPSLGQQPILCLNQDLGSGVPQGDRGQIAKGACQRMHGALQQ